MSDSVASPFQSGQIPMTLAAIAYAAAADIPAQLANPSYATKGNWRLAWGPGEKEGNQQYVARCTSANLYAVAIRGSVFTFSLAFFENWYDDLDVLDQATFPFFPEGAMIAQGTMDGLNHLTTMRAGGMTLLEFIKEIVVPTRGDLIVTGHSLGAALTSVLAPYIHYELSKLGATLKVHPFTFAAPTAGNKAFADSYNQTFQKTSWRFWNNLDLVPRAWADLPGMKKLYPKPGPECPDGVKAALDVAWGLLRGAEKLEKSHYQQTNGRGTSLTGEVSTSSWFYEVGYQHGHNTYLRLLGAPPVNV